MALTVLANFASFPVPHCFSLRFLYVNYKLPTDSYLRLKCIYIPTNSHGKVEGVVVHCKIFQRISKTEIILIVLLTDGPIPRGDLRESGLVTKA